MKRFLLGILGATLVFSLMLTGCEGGTADPLSSDATLKSIKVNGVEATLGTPAEKWDAAVPGVVELPVDKLADAKVQVATVGEGAVVYYKGGKFGEIPDFVADSTFTFDYGDCLYVEVFSANHDKVLIYQVEIAGSMAQLTGLTVGSVTASMGESGTDVNNLPSTTGEAYLSERALERVVITPTLSDDALRIIYGKGLEGVTPAEFSSTAPSSFAGEDVLYIGVSLSPSSQNYRYYRIVLHSTTPTITDVMLGGRSATGGAQLSGIPIPQFGRGVGKPGATWNDSEIEEGEVWYGTSQEGTSLPLAIVKKVDSTTYQIAVADGVTEPTFGDATNIIPTNGQYLYVKTTGIGEYAEDAYYKIKLTAKDDNRSLAGVTIGGQSVAVGALGTHSFPGSEAYGNYSNGAELAQEGTGIFNWTNLSDLNSVAIVVEPSAASLDIKYGHTDTERDYLVDFTTDSSLSLKIGEWIALEVTSELGEKGWYKFRVKDADIVNGGNLGGNAVVPGKMTVTPGTFGTTITGTAYSLLLEEALTGSITLSVTSIEGITGLTLEAGIMTAGWGGPGLPSSWNNGTFSSDIDFDSTVMIRVTADQLAGTQYYAISVLKDGPPEITSLQIGAVFNWNTYGYDPVVSVTNRGIPSADIGATVAGSVVLTDSQAGAAMPILGTAGVGVSLTFAKTTGAMPNDADFAETIAPDFVSAVVHTPTYQFANNDAIWVKADRGAYTNYYKVIVSVVTLTPNDAKVTALQVGGYPGFGGGVTVEDFGTPANAIDGEITEGAVTLTQVQATSETMAADSSLGPNICVTVGQYAAFRVAKTTGAAPQEADWKTQTQSMFGLVNPQLVFENNDILWIEGSAGDFKQFYKIVVTVSE
ncbi:MAG: hypothetical protein LBH75_08715 [Treponema sp.]|nr:hypothetical protein [Treponema sp.]